MHTARIADVYDADGPFASVFVDLSHDTPDGAHRRQLKIEEAIRRLAEQGAPQEVVDAVRGKLEEPVDEPAPVSRFVVANAGGVLFDDVVPERAEAVASWAPLPDVTAWIAVQDSFVPFALVVADREGSDIEIYRSSASRPSDSTEVHGETFHIHKVPVGGWSQDRYQNATEEVWKRNAAETAKQIDSFVGSGVRLVVLAGDQRARGEIKDAVGSVAAERIVETEAGGRAAGASREALESAVGDLLRGEVVDARLQQVHTYQDRRGENRAVATGIQEVSDAFVRGQVDTLLIDPGPARETEVRPADHPGLSLGTGDRAPQPADLALISAAVRTSASVVVVPSAALGGEPAAALLRWDQ